LRTAADDDQRDGKNQSMRKRVEEGSQETIRCEASTSSLPDRKRAPIYAANLTAARARTVFEGGWVAPEDYIATVYLLERTRGSGFHAALGARRPVVPEA